MRRVRDTTDGDEEEERPAKKQAHDLSSFFRRVDGLAISPPKLFALCCPYCSFRATSEISEVPLPGALKVHVLIKHPDDYFEASCRMHAALGIVRRTMFDFEPLEAIPEAPDDENIAAPAPTLGKSVEKPKVQRHSYTYKEKFRFLAEVDKAEIAIKAKLGADAVFRYYQKSVLEEVENKTGVPQDTLKHWMRDKEQIRTVYLGDKLARKSKKRGSGRHPAFPKAEEAVAKTIREKRAQCKLVSKASVLKQFKLEAEKENLAEFRKCLFSPQLIQGFMRRQRFSLRFPSCTRSDNLDDAILICRGYLRELLVVLSDSGEVKYARKPLDPSFGRFLLKYRFNGDEVPYRFGRVKSIVSITNEKLTHVAWPPGWEARLATIYLIMDARGRIVLLVLIFQGNFEKTTKKRRAEVAEYVRKYPNVRVYFQKKAWMDGALLVTITKNEFLPYLRNMWMGDQVDFAESLLVLDNGPGRTDANFLKALGECKAFLEKLPPNQTGHVQMVDDNVGRILRDLACDFLEEEVEAMPRDKLMSLTAAMKRDIMVMAASKVYLKWMSSDHHISIGSRAALRTGLAMRIDNNCDGVVPARFPKGFELTIPGASGAPVRSYYTQDPIPPVTIIADIPATGEVSIQFGDLPPTADLRVNFSATSGATLGIRMKRSPATARVEQEVGLFDGWASDEEERVFLGSEVSASDSSSDEEGPYARRTVRRRRWCLVGCDCEKPLGSRKCSCERTGDHYCSKHCVCDPTLCRSRRPVDDDDDDEDSL